jgi:hypothetical protein
MNISRIGGVGAMVVLAACSAGSSGSGPESRLDNAGSSTSGGGKSTAPTGGGGTASGAAGGGGSFGAGSTAVGAGSSGGGSPGTGGPSVPGGVAGGSAAGSGAAAGDGTPAGGGASASPPAAGTGPAGTGVGTGVGPGTGILTAGLWDDSLNFDFFSQYQASHGQGILGDPGFTAAEYQAAHAAFALRTPHTVIDAALVLDTTGSMGDELSYLTAEFAGISSAIQTALPNATQRWALVVYRDTPDSDPGDEYVVKSFDFTANAQDFAATLANQHAANGGDYPESPELGLEQLGQLSWRTDPSVAKLAFWVADAPHHEQRGAAMKKAITDVSAAGVHLYPVSASGTNDLLELTMRSAAEITGGRYLFLTDDSGVGDPHKVPEIPCYFVTKLAKALVRAVAMEVSGAAVAPDAADIVRTVGAPAADGQCTTPDGQTVQIL